MNKIILKIKLDWIGPYGHLGWAPRWASLDLHFALLLVPLIWHIELWDLPDFYHLGSSS